MLGNRCRQSSNRWLADLICSSFAAPFVLLMQLTTELGYVGLDKVIKDNGQLALHMCAREAAWMAAASSFADWHRTWPSSEAVCRLLIKAFAQVKPGQMYQADEIVNWQLELVCEILTLF